MKLKFIYDEESAIPAAFKDLFEKGSDNKWRLQVEGAVAAERVTEFRDLNTGLKKAMEQVLAAVTGKDVSEFRDFKIDQVAALAETAVKELRDSGDKKTKKEIEDAVEARIGTLKKDHETTLQKTQAERDKYLRRVEALEIDTAAIDLASKQGLLPEAHATFARHARDTWQLVDGKLVAMKDGKEVFGKNAEPITMDAWVKDQTQTAKFFFGQSQGSGGSGSDGKQTTFSGNPWEKGKENLTEQMKLEGASPTEAARMKAAAGAATV